MLFSDLMRYVEQEYRIAVSLEVCHPVFFHREELKLAPDQYLHHIIFCRAVKLHDEHRVCIRNKDRSILIARHGRCFCGKCPFGILEYAAPILYEDQLAAVLYLGGFVESGWQPPDFYHDEMPLPAGKNQRAELRKHALFLKKNLEIELHAIGKKGGMNIVKRHDDRFYIRNALAFIDGHYQENISLADLADMLRVNPNYLGSVIQKKLHATFREKLTEKRLREAEILLRLHNWLSIGEIAFKCGFSDSNYFSARFHRKLGMTPTEYRKKQQSAK